MPGSAWSAGPSVLPSRPSLPDRIEDPSRPPPDLEQPRRVGLEPIKLAAEPSPSSVTKPALDFALPQAGGSVAGDRAATVVTREGTPEQAMVPQASHSASIGHLQPEAKFFITAPRGLRPAAEPPSPAAAEPVIFSPQHDEAIVPPREWRSVTPSQPLMHEEPIIGLPVDTTKRPNNGSSDLVLLPMRATAEPGRSDEIIGVAPTAEPGSHSINPTEQVALAAPTHRVSFPESQWLAATPSNAAASARNGSRITIGRVEVHVNNRVARPVVSRPERRQVSWSAPGSLDSHYLDRFFLRR
jgi:hypothetical protein